jgi:CRP-like cAMP-binding protein
MPRFARKVWRAPEPVIPVSNDILAALVATEYKRLLPRLEHVILRRGEIIYRADQDIDAVYFPEEAVVAMVDTTEDRRTIEVGIIGREGIVGINIFLGGVVTPDRAIVQLPGGAFRMKSKDLQKEVRFGSALQRLLLDYTRVFLAVISQSVACSQHHNIEQRLARWLLTMNDYAGSREFLMDHQSIAAMLGTRRVSITEAARKLQEAALISYRRGRMSVINKPGLKGKSCECYGFIRQQYQSVPAKIRRLLSEKQQRRTPTTRGLAG